MEQRQHGLCFAPSLTTHMYADSSCTERVPEAEMDAVWKVRHVRVPVSANLINLPKDVWHAAHGAL